MLIRNHKPILAVTAIIFFLIVAGLSACAAPVESPAPESPPAIAEERETPTDIEGVEEAPNTVDLTL